MQLMLYAIFQLNIFSGSGGKFDFSGLAISSNSGHIDSDQPEFIILQPYSLVMLHVKFENHRCSGFRE